MKKNILSRLENKVYYGISRTFWHIIIGVAALVIFAGILVIGYSFLPTSKREVVKEDYPEKQAYPPKSEISLNELLAAMIAEKYEMRELPSEAYSDTKRDETQVVKTKDTTGLHAFELSVAQLRNLISPTKHPDFWNGKGTWEIIDQRRWLITKSNQFRRYIRQENGYQQKALSAIFNNGFDSYIEATEIMEAIYDAVKKVPDSERIFLAEELIDEKNGSLEKTISSIDAMGELLAILPNNTIRDGYRTVRKFMQNNPNDGVSMVAFQGKYLVDFGAEERFDAMLLLNRTYRAYYDNNLEALKEIALDYGKIVYGVPPSQHVVGLSFFFDLYKSRNADRMLTIQEIETAHASAIAQIEAEYQSQLMQANREYNAKESQKEEFRWYSLQGLGVGFVAVLLISVILLLLSMVRNVNRLAQAMLANTRSIQVQAQVQESSSGNDV